MSVSSGTRTSAFSDLTLHQALVLLETLEDRRLRTASHVRRAFLQRAREFEATLSFLVRIGVVEHREGTLSFRITPPSGSTRAREEWLLRRVLRRRNRFRSELFRYLASYKVIDGELAIPAQAQGRSHESGSRNFLMEMGIVQYDADRSRYTLSREFVSLYATAREGAHRVAPEQVVELARTRDEFGLAAERAVVAYEKCRLAPELADEVDHVALRNAAAGYDIRSVTVTGRESTAPRYVEVKAVPASSLRFYWTRNEVSVAEALRELYFLYLLPVTAGGDFDLARLVIIRDPCTAVLGPQAMWIVEPDAVCCRLLRGEGVPLERQGEANHA